MSRSLRWHCQHSGALRLEAAIFDFNGTLVDTSTANTDTVRASFADLSLTVPEPWLREAPLADLTALRERLRCDLDLQLSDTDPQFVTRTRAHWLTLTHLVQPVERVTAVARHLADRVPVAVASANDGQIVRAGLAAAGLADLFETVIAREHVARPKPDPAAYLLAAAELAVPTARCLAFENTTEGITAARADRPLAGGVNATVTSPLLPGEIAAMTDPRHRDGNHGWADTTLCTADEPRPMCIGALIRAGPRRIVRAGSIDDTPRRASPGPPSRPAWSPPEPVHATAPNCCRAASSPTTPTASSSRPAGYTGPPPAAGAGAVTA
ncbi:HAD-IA family hydrolase [Kitasatospora aureofaciens]|uniref:HAD-IA family hydrolase n=1 Tax=Kitasatospora aureofaciens TaxID=1894 RepID=UPI0006924130|nr:HAD-IA family hydrolase [Kitasatospora aureofaciens]